MDPWYDCGNHEWKEWEFDYDLGEGRSQVYCVRCKCPGERNDKTGEVFWPAT